ncbi:MAG: glycosyltransferase family 4 protein [Acidobacteriia bacterium]|nr:glycosyltransferase family 4 protein [Terriglobia bacterium]
MRLAVVSPFLDRVSGTERIVSEWISHLPDDFEIHLYSQRVEDVDLSRIIWHRIPALPGPHLFNFLWWVAANHIWRAWDRRFRGLRYDLVFSPGCNCFDADAVSVHICFAEYVRHVRDRLSFKQNPLKAWPRIVHRKLYYELIAFLERRTYTRPDVALILIARKTAAELERHYGRREGFPVLYLGLDHKTFNPERRRAMRADARRSLGLSDDRFALLLIGNDWRNKGVPVLLDAMARLPELPLDLLIVSQEDPAAVRAMALEKSLDGRLHFLPPRKDVEFYYAAADAYAGPSLEDTFALPPAEAMACGLPVIVSGTNGTSEIMTHGVDGLILDDPTDAAGLAAMIGRLCEDKEFCIRLGARAAETALQYTWERNGRDLAAIFEEIVARKARPAREPGARALKSSGLSEAMTAPEFTSRQNRIKPQLAVVSPFLDKRHGTERRVVEWITQLADEFEIHIYGQRVEDMDLSRITWHRIPKLPGPHLFNFAWWVLANYIWRAWDRRFRGLRYALVYSPGCNCFDADLVSVHICFAEYVRHVGSRLSLRRSRVRDWPRIIHRKLYYKLICFLERRTYTRPEVALILIAQRTAAELELHYGRRERFPVLYLGLDHKTFNPERRMALRAEARRSLGLSDDRFALLLIGNDWRNKGVPVLLEALGQLREYPLELLVVSREEPEAVRRMAAEKGLEGRVHLVAPRKDVEFYYAAVDAYVGPSLEDTFALPPAEAMACGLPVIVSAANGTSEIITHGVDGLILAVPTDVGGLAAMIGRLCRDKEFRMRLGENAVETARQYTWERNGRDLAAIFEEILARKTRPAGETLTQEL